MTVVNDVIKGTITFSNEELDDLVIERADGYPTYNFAVVVDDAQMGITHVLRGDDHVNNTPRQILLYEALGYEVPHFGHVPMILGSDKARLSKRHGATSVMAYKDMGFLPEALVNYLVRLGWSHGDQEIFSMTELVELFDLSAVGKSAAIFNPEKLLWLNSHYIKEYPLEKLAACIKPFWAAKELDVSNRELMSRAADDLRSRSKTMVEMADSGEFYFVDEVIYDPDAAKKFLTQEIMEHLQAVGRELPTLDDYSKTGIEQYLRRFTEEKGLKLKVIAQPLRVALTGKTVSPGIDDVMITLGKERVARRLAKAVEFISDAGKA